MIRKKWTRNESNFLTTVCFMSEETIRICGEIHYYVIGINLESGNYEVFIYYYKEDEYNEVAYDEGVNRTFTVAE